MSKLQINNTQLIKSQLVHTFGQKTNNPYLVVRLRLSVAIVAAFVLGIILKNSIQNASLPTDLPQLLVYSGLATFSFTIVGLVMFPLSTSRIGSTRTNSFYKLLSVLPVTHATKWFLNLLPLIIILSVIFAFIVPIGIGLSAAFAVQWFVGAITVMFGAIAGLAISLFRWPNMFILRSVIFLGLVAIQIRIIERAIVANEPELNVRLISLIFVILTVSCLGLWHSYISNSNDEPKRLKQRYIMPGKILNKWWFLPKVFRNQHMIVSLSFCILTIVIVALSIYVRKLGTIGPGWFIFSGILTAALMCDIRGLSRRYKPPEIWALNGITFFIKSQILPVFVLSIIVGLPIFIISVIYLPANFLVNLLFFTSVQASTGLIGLMLGFVFVPTSSDIGAQFFSAMVSIAVVVLIPKILNFAQYSLVSQSFLWIICGLFSVITMYMIELRRQKSYGSS